MSELTYAEMLLLKKNKEDDELKKYKLKDKGFYCPHCDYLIDVKGTFKRHLETPKHEKNEDETRRIKQSKQSKSKITDKKKGKSLEDIIKYAM